MALTRTQVLLHTICDLIPDPSKADLIRGMDPNDEITFAEAYCVVRDLPTLTPELRRRILEQVYVLADEKTEQILREKPAKPSRGRLYIAPLLRLVEP